MKIFDWYPNYSVNICLHLRQRNGAAGYGCDAVPGHGANPIEGLLGRVVEVHSHMFNSG